MCQSKGLVPLLSCMLESPVALTAALHVARSWVDKCGFELCADLDAVDLIKEQPFFSPWDQRRSGCLPLLGQGMGLGVSFKE